MANKNDTYSEAFERDYAFYLANIDVFNFSGTAQHLKRTVEVYRDGTVINIFSYGIFVDVFGEDILTNAEGHYSYKIVSENKVQQDLENGKDAKFCFYMFDVYGIIIATKEPELLSKLYTTKGSVNFEVKQWATGLKEGTLAKKEIKKFLKKIKAPDWVYEATLTTRDSLGPYHLIPKICS